MARRSEFDYLSAEELKELRSYHKDNKIQLCDRASVVFVGNSPVLVSYWTEVARIDNGKLIRLWDGWSDTTQKHVKMFCALFHVEPPRNKKAWCDMEIGR